MPSIKRLSSVCHSIAHHAVSSLSYVHPHLRQACKTDGIDAVTIDLMREQPCPDQFLSIEPLRLSLKALKEKFKGILKAEGFTIDEIESIELRFEFTEEFPDDYCSNCYACLVSRTGKVYGHGVNYIGETIHPTRPLEELRIRMKITLPSPKCSKEFTPREILEASTISWPELCWIYFKCPACEKFTHIHIKNGKMSTVNFLGAPGPDWEINTSIEIKDLKIRMDPGFAHVWLDGKHYEFEARK